LEDGKKRIESGDIPLEQIEVDFMRAERLKLLRNQRIQELRQAKGKGIGWSLH